MFLQRRAQAVLLQRRCTATCSRCKCRVSGAVYTYYYYMWNQRSTYIQYELPPISGSRLRRDDYEVFASGCYYRYNRTRTFLQYHTTEVVTRECWMDVSRRSTCPSPEGSLESRVSRCHFGAKSHTACNLSPWTLITTRTSLAYSDPKWNICHFGAKTPQTQRRAVADCLKFLMSFYYMSAC